MKTPIYSVSVLLALALPLAAQNATTTTSTTVITTPGPTPTVVPDASAGAVAVPSKAPITNPNEAPSNAPVRRTMYQVIDTNADGQISRLEFETYGAVQANSPAGTTAAASTGNSGSGATGNAIGSTTNFPLLDVNSDGYLNQEEFARSSYHQSAEAAAVDTTREPGNTAAVVTTGPAAVVSATTVQVTGAASPMFQAVDTNLDGQITLQEFQRYHAVLKDETEVKGLPERSFGDSFRALDSDSDGKLNLQEFSRANAKADLPTTIKVPGSGN